MGEKKHNKIPPKIPGQSREMFVYVFSSLCVFWHNRKGGTASSRSRMCVKHNAVFGARFKCLSLYFLYQKGNLIRIKTGLDTYLIHIQTRTPLPRYPPYDCSKFFHSQFSLGSEMSQHERAIISVSQTCLP